MERITRALILGKPHLHVELNLQWFDANLANIFVPLYTDTLLYAVTVSIAVYYSTNWLWIHSVKKEKRHAKRKRNQKR